MDKETLGQYGWLVVCVVIMAIMITLATPFGSVIRGEVEGIVTNFKDTATTALDGIIVESSFGGGGSSGGTGGETGGDEGSGGETGGTEDGGNENEPAEVITYYTSEDVDNSNGKLVKLGNGSTGTSTLNVIGALNDASTEMTITKNGEESDGKFAQTGNVPSGIESVIIKPGIVNVPGSAFANIKDSLVSISIPNTVTSIGQQAFFECALLESVDIPSSVTSIGQSAFQKCTTLASVTLHDGLESIGSKAFQNCKVLTSIVIPDSVTSFGDWVFTNCYALEDVTLSNNITAIKENTFLSCTSLKSIVIPGKVESIGTKAFGYCSKLESVTIPSSVTSIADDAFTNCGKLTTVYGQAGSYAETWATANGYTFVAA